MVEKGNYIKCKQTALDYDAPEEVINMSGNGRVYYEYLKEQKNRQKSLVNGYDSISMPLDASDYNIMFMTF